MDEAIAGFETSDMNRIEFFGVIVEIRCANSKKVYNITITIYEK